MNEKLHEVSGAHVRIDPFLSTSVSGSAHHLKHIMTYK